QVVERMKQCPRADGRSGYSRSMLGGHSEEPSIDVLRRAATAFANGIAEHHGADLSPTQLEAILARTLQWGGSLDATDSRREFYRPILAAVDGELGVTTPAVTASQMRLIATSEAGVGLGAPASSTAMASPSVDSDSPVRFLDRE